MTVYEIFKLYENSKSHVLSKRTFATNVSNYYNHIHPNFGNRELSELRYQDYQNFVNNLLKKYKVKTIKNILIVMSSIYDIAFKYDVCQNCDKKILSYIELPNFDNRRYFTLNLDLQQAYIKAILNFDEYPMNHIFKMLLHSRRLSEVLELTFEQIDLNDKIMYLPCEKNKSKKNLSFMLTDLQIIILNHHYQIAVYRQNKAFPTGYVFINPNTKTRYKDVRSSWYRLLDNAHLPRIRIHDIRHLVATYLINHCHMSIEVVSQTLGHSDIKITQRYLNPSPKNSKLAMDKLLKSVENSAFFDENVSPSSVATALATDFVNEQ